MQDTPQIEVIKGRLLINSLDSLKIVSVSDIIRIEAQDESCRLYTHNGTSVTISMLIDEIEWLLKEKSFFRTHAKHIINTTFLTTYTKGETASVLLSDGTEWPVAWEYADGLVEFLGTIDINIITD